MNDLKNLAIYGGGALVVIFGLIFGAKLDAISSDAIGILAILAVIIVPVAIGVAVAKRERQNSDDA